MRSQNYQVALIILGAVATAFFGVFVYRELYPEYSIYQKDYIALEQFRSTYTHKPPSDFKEGVKQILLETGNNGEPVIDRCISCHVVLDVPYFSPTKIAYDVNGKIILDEKGIPVKIPNEDYIWGKLDARIAELTDKEVNHQLEQQGDLSTLTARLKEAEQLKALKTVELHDQVFDVTKALSMHPLIGRETRPFEFHPISDYGCTSCHGGNGRALTADKAHGPVFEDKYEAENRGPVPKFLEEDPDNDPRISKIFNHKPGEELIFQTTPILVDGLIEAKCMQCHQSGQQFIQGALGKTETITNNSSQILEAIALAYQNEKQSLATLLKLREALTVQGLNKTITNLQSQLDNYLVPPENRNSVEAQIKFLMGFVNKNSDDAKTTEIVLSKLNQDIEQALGSSELTKRLESQINFEKNNINDQINQFIEAHRLDQTARGSLFLKANSLDYETNLIQHIRDTQTSLLKSASDQTAMNAIQTDIDQLTQTHTRGKQLFIEQACYACHRIAGLSRGGIGPELTTIGKNYPWYIKHHIVWPQGDLPTSTMPNFRLDHEELEPLLSFLLAKQGQNDAISRSEYRKAIMEWEAGKLQAWEKPISPAQMYDLRYSMTIFATEGCAACHRLKGFESNVGYAVEKDQKEKLDFNTLYREREWFTKIFPEELVGSQIVAALDKHSKEIDQRIVNNVRENSILEELQEKHPGTVEAFYQNFRFAARAKNKYYQDLAAKENDPAKKKEILDQLKQYKERLHRVLMIYIQEYGLGRLIGPRPNWSGIFRSDAWLMEHFIKPTAHVARSIMPVFPFDNTKFYALTHMLDVLAKQNRDWDRQLWENRGFNPALAYQLHCSQCHGEFLGGNGPVSNWIYPIPKNLRSPEFLRNYTRDRVMNSIIHGVIGTPMPPWGEVASKPQTDDHIPVLTRSEIEQLVDWMYSTLPGSTIFKQTDEVPKWNYQPEDVLKELKDEGSQLKTGEANPSLSLKNIFPSIPNYLASLQPTAIDTNELNVADVFDIIPNKAGSLDKDSYYIKSKFYTEQNIKAGHDFFQLYCATCHGAEADGMGARAAVMQDAKPRMLNNLDWLNTHDDLYLLRSIKYGVPGTSMTPWGDQTSSLLRLQLVIFIRSLGQEGNHQKKLDELLFQTFDVSNLEIDTSRVELAKVIRETDKKLQEAKKNQNELFKRAESNPELQNQLLDVYKKQLELATKLNKENQINDLLVQLKKTIDREKKIYKDLGIELLSSKMNDKMINTYLEIINLQSGKFKSQDGHLIIRQDEDIQTKIKQLKNTLLAELNQRLSKLDEERKLIDAKYNSATREKELQEITAQIKSLNDYKERLETSFQESDLIRQEQMELVEKFNKQLKLDKETTHD